MSEEAEPTPAEGEEKWPLGFIVLVVSAAIYLGWRLIQGIAWLVDWVSG